MENETERLRRRIAELEAENAELRIVNESRSLLMETMAIAFVLYEVIYEDGKAVDGRFLDANAGAEGVLGLKREAFIGKTMRECFPGSTAPWVNVFNEGVPETVERSIYYSPLFHRYFDVVAYSPGRDRYAVLFFDITEHKALEETLRESETRLRTIIENMPALLVAVDAERRVILWNRECERVTGYSAAEMIGRDDLMTVLYPDEDYRAGLLAAAAAQGGMYRGWETELRRKDGSRRTVAWFSVSGEHPIKGWGRWALGSDVTPKAQAEREIRRLNAELERRVAERTAELEEVNEALQAQIIEVMRAQDIIERHDAEITDLYDNAPCGYHSLDANGVFIRINDTELKMLGYTREEVVGKMTYLDLYPPEALAAARERFERLRREGAVWGAETDVLRKDGKRLPVLLNATVVFDGDGQFLWTRSTMVDMSDLRRAQDIIMQLNLHLEERALMLEAANQELEAFSYSVSHDLRAPLRAIDGFSRVVMENYGAGLPEQGQHYLKRVRENAGRMGQLIDDLLDFSRINRRPVNKGPVSPVQIALQVVNDIREQQPELTVEIVVNEMPGCEADGTLLRQVYANLIGNAVKFTRGRAGARIEVGCDQSGGDAVFYVRDNGVGFDMEYADKLFGVFQRLHSSQAYEGTGVGLATVQRIIQRHGGRVWAEGAVDKGATFYFTVGV